jgi:hypothetical protein
MGNEQLHEIQSVLRARSKDSNTKDFHKFNIFKLNYQQIKSVLDVIVVES